LHGTDDDGVLSFEVEDSDFEQDAIGRRNDDEAELGVNVLADAFRTACSMSSSGTACLRAGSPILTQTS
jgi:hypothetical protein